MDLVTESFNVWIAGGGRIPMHNDVFDFYEPDALEDGNELTSGGSFKKTVELEFELNNLELAIKNGETEEEHYRKLVVPDDDQPTKKDKNKNGGGPGFKDGFIAMLESLPLK